MNKTKRYISSVIALIMLVGMLTTNVKAEIKDSKNTEIKAVEMESSSRLEELQIKPNEIQVDQVYEDDEIVTAIIEMEEAPVMDYYGESSYYSIDNENTPGEAVSKFLSSEDAKNASEQLVESQQKVISEMTNLLNGDSVNTRSLEKFEVVNKWTTLVNAIAVKVPYSMIDKIKNINGVKSAYVEHIYDYPEIVENSVVEEGKETYSYSYDMVGVEEAWAKGYTGKEMLVAVLDTGLDLKMDWNSEVVRVHEAFTNDSFKSGNPTDGVDDWNLRYTDSSLEEFLKENQLNSTTGQSGNQITYDKNALYKNLKVPYACDYADGDLNVFNENSNHGTHVTGTIAGFASTSEGEVEFSGVSPDAQVLFMKVFSNVDSGATESTIINALEDSLKLGADVINLSLGSDNGFAADDTVQNGIYERVNKSGVVLMTSAGNSAKSSSGNNYDGQALTDNPDESMISSPAVYNSNLSVASMENNIDVRSYLIWKDSEAEEHNVYFNDPWYGLLKENFSDKEYPIYAVDGVGTYSDFYKAGFNNGYNNGKTGFALVKRGEISFVDKINNAMMFSGVNSRNEAYGVLGVIIYDDDPNSTELITMSVSGTALYSAFISGKDGAELVEQLEKNNNVKIRVSDIDETIDSTTAGEMSSFTSWGASPALELKPEITAPGGNIWSSVAGKSTSNNSEYNGSYEMMSGTSMAAPHMTGIGTLVRQRVITEESFSGITSNNIGDVTSQLLVSTAVPKKDKNGVYYSPRQQGAGLVNAAAAISTPAYISVDGEKVGKLELGDDPNKDGNFDIKFNLNNISQNTVNYNVEVVLMRPNIESTDSSWGERNTITNNDTILKTVNLGEISASAESSTSFEKVISLNDDEKAQLDELFENGTYVEGYVILTDDTTNNPTLGLPMLSFYGDWTKSSIFDSASWIDEPADGENVFENESTWNTNIVGSTLMNDIYGVIGYFNLGQNIFDSTSITDQLVYNKENITLSPNGDEYFDRIDDYILYQLRDAKLVVIEAKDAETGEVYMSDWTSYSSKSLYNSSIQAPIPFSVYGTFPTWNGTDKEGNILPSGTKCVYTITAYGEGEYGDKVYEEETDIYVTNFDSIIPGENEPTFNGHEMDMTGDVIEFPVTIDTVAPKLSNNAVTIYEEDGRTYITGKVYDEDGALASIEIAPQVVRSYKDGYGDPNYLETGLDRTNLFYINNIYDPATKELTFTADITEYSHSKEAYPGENNYYDYEWTGNIILSCGDYGANDRSYAIKVDSTEGIVLSQTSALLNPGQKFELSVNNNTLDEDSIITRISSNPEVATIDEFGLITAIAPGQATITVSDGIYSADCIVAVEEKNTEVKDFDLSIDSFSGLKPEGQVVVKVKNLQPSDVKVENIRWEIFEDEDFVNEYGSGVVTVGKNSSDALSGYIHLNISTSQDIIPGGKGILKVTIGDIVRTMEIDWEQLYQNRGDDDIVSNVLYSEQTVYVKQGEIATISAKYRQSALHQIGDVNTELTGLKLDGADFFSIGGEYKAKLVNEEGYSLPSNVHLYTVYSDGYKYEIINYPGYTSYTYDSSTGEIDVIHAPTGATNKLLIVADGVVSEGSEAGVMSGATYTKPDEMFGPFDWKVTQGNGTIEMGTKTIYGSSFEVANYTPSEPGISYITATTKDGKYSINFAVVSEEILPSEISLDSHRVDIKVGETANVVATVSPTPSYEKDEELVWTSFNPEVATVSEDGVMTGVSEGYAYVKVESKVDCTVESYCIIHVTENIKNYTVTFKDFDGTILKEEIVQEGNSAVAPQDPVREGYKFIGWDISFDNVKENLTVVAQYSEENDDDLNDPGNDGDGGDNSGNNGNTGDNSGDNGNTGDDSTDNGNEGNNSDVIVNDSGNSDNNSNKDSLENSSDNKIPVTGGINWFVVSWFAIILFIVGIFMVTGNKKRERKI